MSNQLANTESQRAWQHYRESGSFHNPHPILTDEYCEYEKAKIEVLMHEERSH
ncbi:hypothetical protein [Marinibactrum halimedae]|uniref:hypothetical protein n=1 Tax=Marinibactrum halimedae TaxID=1444977 RepID=UPI001E3016AF|nr:hypothetical protein [Marinibactrum halimedae]MCD9458917.1 hypothetical protein [Marinibactrum halimedae]